MDGRQDRSHHRDVSRNNFNSERRNDRFQQCKQNNNKRSGEEGHEGHRPARSKHHFSKQRHDVGNKRLEDRIAKLESAVSRNIQGGFGSLPLIQPPNAPVALIDGDNLCFRVCSAQAYYVKGKRMLFREDVLRLQNSDEKCAANATLGVMDCGLDELEFEQGDFEEAEQVDAESKMKLPDGVQKLFMMPHRSVALRSFYKEVLEILQQVGAKEHYIILKGNVSDTFKHSFRRQVCPDYKKNRELRSVLPKEAKTMRYLRRWLLSHSSPFRVVLADPEVEADDELAIMQTSAIGGSTVICSVDKDLLQVPGWHYNYERRQLQYITELQASQNFYTQVLIGDSVDNVDGIFRITGQRAIPRLKLPLAGMRTELEMYSHVVSTFASAIRQQEERKNKVPDSGLVVHEHAEAERRAEGCVLKSARLLWLQRQRPPALWSPPV